MLEATRASLREHMEIIRGLRAELAFATQKRNAYQNAVDVACEERDRLRAEVADHKAAFNKLNEMLAESLEDRDRLREFLRDVAASGVGDEALRYFVIQIDKSTWLDVKAALGGEKNNEA